MGYDPAVLDQALAVESTAEPASDHAALADLFRKALDSVQADHPSRPPLSWETQLYQYQLTAGSEPGTAFLPMFEMTDGQSYPPPIAQLPDDAIAYFTARLKHAVHPVARARLADVRGFGRSK